MSPCLATPPSSRAADLTVGAIARRFGPAFAAQTALGSQQRRTLEALQQCRTPTLGGQWESCDTCGTGHLHCFSCRNRHCPTCQSLAQKTWIEQRARRVLPVPHFHVVFTLPAALRPLARAHRLPLFSLLFKAASATLLTFGSDPKHLGAQLGVTAVLHTWTRDLQFHPHLHCIVTAGGLSREGARWLPGSPRFLFPVKALSSVFRGKFLDGLQQLFDQGKLPSLKARDLQTLRASLLAQPWVVYAKAPFGGTSALFSYLGRYTHRTGISNQRLLSISADAITFRTRGKKRCSLTPFDFLRRFLLHVLPLGFVKMRHYGLYASSNVNGRLLTAHRLLSQPSTPVAGSPSVAGNPSAGVAAPGAGDTTIARPLPLCPVCQRGRLRPCGILLPLPKRRRGSLFSREDLAKDTS